MFLFLFLSLPADDVEDFDPGGGICLLQAQTPHALPTALPSTLPPGGVLTEATHLAADASWGPAGLCPCGESGKLCPTLVTPLTAACQAPLSMGFSRQDYWSVLPFPSPEDLPDPGIKPVFPAL